MGNGFGGYENGNRRGFNAGDALHIVQIAILLITLGIGYEKLQETEQMVIGHTQVLNHIEHYLSSKDSHYWDDVNREK